jgi:hypothetical protein
MSLHCCLSNRIAGATGVFGGSLCLVLRHYLVRAVRPIEIILLRIRLQPPDTRARENGERANHMTGVVLHRIGGPLTCQESGKF